MYIVSLLNAFKLFNLNSVNRNFWLQSDGLTYGKLLFGIRNLIRLSFLQHVPFESSNVEVLHKVCLHFVKKRRAYNDEKERV